MCFIWKFPTIDKGRRPNIQTQVTFSDVLTPYKTYSTWGSVHCNSDCTRGRVNDSRYPGVADFHRLGKVFYVNKISRLSHIDAVILFFGESTYIMLVQERSGPNSGAPLNWVRDPAFWALLQSNRNCSSIVWLGYREILQIDGLVEHCDIHGTLWLNIDTCCRPEEGLRPCRVFLFFYVPLTGACDKFCVDTRSWLNS